MASTVKTDIVKPTANNGSLILQGDNGGSGVSGPSIDSSGDVDFTQNTDAKIKLPSAGGIYESDGSTAVLTESGGSVTLANIALAATVTGQAPEGTAVKSTGESGATKFLREDGDGTCSWQTPSAVPTGLIAPFAMASAPTGWLICDGSAISRSTYSDLFSAVSTAWGTGDGSSTFNIPDLRGYFLRGFDNGAGNDPDAGSRTGGDAIGSSQGDSVRLHSHGIESLNPHSGSSGAGNRPVAGNIGYPQNGVGTTAHVFNFAQTNRPIPYGFLNTYSVGGEGRPKNKYVQYMIKI